MEYVCINFIDRITKFLEQGGLLFKAHNSESPVWRTVQDVAELELYDN